MGGEGTAKLGEDLEQTAWGKLVSSQDTRDELRGGGKRGGSKPGNEASTLISYRSCRCKASVKRCLQRAKRWAKE